MYGYGYGYNKNQESLPHLGNGEYFILWENNFYELWADNNYVKGKGN